METRTTTFNLPKGRELLHQLIAEITEGLGEFDTFIVKRLITLELYEEFYHVNDEKVSTSPYIVAYARVTDQPVPTGHLVSMFVLTSAVASSRKEISQLWFLTNSWNDIHAYMEKELTVSLGDRLRALDRDIVEEITKYILWIREEMK